MDLKRTIKMTESRKIHVTKFFMATGKRAKRE